MGDPLDDLQAQVVDLEETKPAAPGVTRYNFLTITGTFIPGWQIVRVLGLVRGTAAVASHLGKDILIDLRNIVGGEVKVYADILDKAMHLADRRMAEQAGSMGGHAVIEMRYSIASPMPHVLTVTAYGTAVQLAPEST